MVLPVRRDRVAGGVGVTAAAAVFVGCWVVLHHWFYARHVITDTPVYEGYGEHAFSAGDCVLQPPGIVHNELECSDDLEVLEVYSPAVHETEVVGATRDPPSL